MCKALELLVEERDKGLRKEERIVAELDELSRQWYRHYMQDSRLSLLHNMRAKYELDRQIEAKRQELKSTREKVAYLQQLIERCESAE